MLKTNLSASSCVNCKLLLTETEQDAAETESNQSDLPPLFGMLGLVKKQPSAAVTKGRNKCCVFFHLHFISLERKGVEC